MSPLSLSLARGSLFAAPFSLALASVCLCLLVHYAVSPRALSLYLLLSLFLYLPLVVWVAS